MSKLDAVIATLNTLDVGSLEAISEKLAGAQDELRRHEGAELDEIVSQLDSCRAALAGGQLEDFRRLRETIVSRLGHLRQKKA